MSKEESVNEREFPKDQSDAQTLAREGDIIAGMREAEKPYAESEAEQNRTFGSILQGMLEAAKFQTTRFKTIEIVRNGVTYFQFRIRPLTEKEYERCRNSATKFVRNKQLGIKMPESTDNVKYRAALIYAATDADDRKRTWDNKQLWNALEQVGAVAITGTDVIDAVLMPGEKAAVVEEIDKLSGFENENLEEVAKN